MPQEARVQRRFLQHVQQAGHWPAMTDPGLQCRKTGSLRHRAKGGDGFPHVWRKPEANPVILGKRRVQLPQLPLRLRPHLSGKPSGVPRRVQNLMAVITFLGKVLRQAFGRVPASVGTLDPCFPGPDAFNPGCSRSVPRDDLAP